MQYPKHTASWGRRTGLHSLRVWLCRRAGLLLQSLAHSLQLGHCIQQCSQLLAWVGALLRARLLQARRDQGRSAVLVVQSAASLLQLSVLLPLSSPQLVELALHDSIHRPAHRLPHQVGLVLQCR